MKDSNSYWNISNVKRLLCERTGLQLFDSFCCWWNKSITLSVRLVSEQMRNPPQPFHIKTPFVNDTEGRKVSVFLVILLPSLQLYCCISLFKAKYHQPPGRPILISWGSCGTPPSVQHKYPHAPVQMTPSDGEQYVKDLQSSSLNQLWQFTQSFVKSFDPALFKGSFFFFFSP